MNQLKGSLLRGGGNDMIALRCYPSDDGIVLCDLFSPASGSIFNKCPTLLGVVVPAPSTEWDGNNIDDLPVVFAVYRSSQGSSPKTPVVVGVLANTYLKYVAAQPAGSTGTTTQPSGTTTQPAGLTTQPEPPSPNVRDAVMASSSARLLLREGGSAHLVANDVTMRADRMLFSDGDDGTDHPALAAPLLAELEALGSRVNSIIEYLAALTIATPTGGVGIPVVPMTEPAYLPPQVADIQSRSVLLPGVQLAQSGTDEPAEEEVTDESV